MNAPLWVDSGKKTNPNDPKSDDAIAAGGTPTQLAQQAAVAAVARRQQEAVTAASASQVEAIKRQRQKAGMAGGQGSTILTGGNPTNSPTLGEGYAGKTLLGM